MCTFKVNNDSSFFFPHTGSYVNACLHYITQGIVTSNQSYSLVDYISGVVNTQKCLSEKR